MVFEVDLCAFAKLDQKFGAKCQIGDLFFQVSATENIELDLEIIKWLKMRGKSVESCGRSYLKFRDQ